MHGPRVLPLMAGACATLALSAATGVARPLVEGADGATYTAPHIDLNARDSLITAWNASTSRGGRSIQVRLRRGAHGGLGPVQDLGAGTVLAARVAGDGRRALVVAARGARRVVLMSTGSRWRVEALPAAARGALAGVEFAGPRVVVVLRDTGRRVRVVVRGGDGRWRASGLLELPSSRETVVAVGERTGMVVAAWATSIGGRGTVSASVWRLATGAWSPPDTLLRTEASVPRALSAHTNTRGDLAVVLSGGAGGFGYGPGGGAVQVAARRAGTATWRLSPGTRASTVALTPAGVVVGAWAPDATTAPRSAAIVARWTPGAGAWAAPRTVARVPGDPGAFAGDVAGVAVTATGRTVVCWYRRTGTAARAHHGAIERSPGGAWGRPVPLGTSIGTLRFAAGGRTAASVVLRAPVGRVAPEPVTIR